MNWFTHSRPWPRGGLMRGFFKNDSDMPVRVKIRDTRSVPPRDDVEIKMREGQAWSDQQEHLSWTQR